MHKTVDHSSCKDFVTKYFSPSIKAQVGGDDCRFSNLDSRVRSVLCDLASLI